MTLPNALRPSMIPPCRTLRSGSSRMMSAASLRDIDGARHRDADVGCVQRGCVVDPVAEKPDYVAAVLERADDPVFLAGRHARENVGLLRRRGTGRNLSCARARRPRQSSSQSIPTCSQTWRVTSSLSPVRILIPTPSARSAATVSATPSAADRET